MTAAASEFPPSLPSVTGPQGPREEQHISHPDILVLQHPDPPALDIHMTPPDDPLAPVPRDLTAYSITIAKYPNSAACFTCGDRIAAREARARKGAKRARVMHLRCCGLTPDELAGVHGWQDVSDVQRDCLVRDIYDEKEIKASDPVPQTEVEDAMAQDITLESELWTFDEVEWHETTQDATTIKYVPVQVRPAVARLRERVAKAATGETGPQQVRAWKLSLSLDRMLFHTSDAKRTNNTSLTKAMRTRIAQVEAGNALEILRQSQQTYVPQRTTKPRADPTADTDKLNQTTIQLIKSAVEDGDGRRAGKLVKGISGMAPLPTSRETGPSSIPRPKRRPVTPRPSPSPKKTSRASSASSCSPSNSLPPTEPRDLVVGGTSIGCG